MTLFSNNLSILNISVNRHLSEMTQGGSHINKVECNTTLVDIIYIMRNQHIISNKHCQYNSLFLHTKALTSVSEAIVLQLICRQDIIIQLALCQKSQRIKGFSPFKEPLLLLGRSNKFMLIMSRDMYYSFVVIMKNQERHKEQSLDILVNKI